uniref:Uncharacterized protein n=1 Tax=Acrobeloides nanus TaxID=290746 RepID=A0A914C3E3_9BILA
MKILVMPKMLLELLMDLEFAAFELVLNCRMGAAVVEVEEEAVVLVDEAMEVIVVADMVVEEETIEVMIVIVMMIVLAIVIVAVPNLHVEHDLQGDVIPHGMKNVGNVTALLVALRYKMAMAMKEAVLRDAAFLDLEAVR